MEYLVKNSLNSDVPDPVEDSILLTDSKKIIQQNNWAVCSFNYNSNRNNQKSEHSQGQIFKSAYLEHEFCDYNNLPTMDFEFTRCPSNKINMKNINIHPGYNEDSTEEFDDVLFPVAIKLPVCPTSQPKNDNKNLVGQSHTSDRRPKGKFEKSITPVSGGVSINTPSDQKSLDPERSGAGPFLITRQRVKPSGVWTSVQPAKVLV